MPDFNKREVEQLKGSVLGGPKFDKPLLKPSEPAKYADFFLSIPNPSGGRTRQENIFYNSDLAWVTNKEDSARMIYDMAIFCPLLELFEAITNLPFSIIPYDDQDDEQNKAAEDMKDILERFDGMNDLIFNLLWALFYGRQGAVIEYEWQFVRGFRQLGIAGWFGIQGDTILFDSNGLAGYLTGPYAEAPESDFINCVEGRGIRIEEQHKPAWVVHHGFKMPGNWMQYQTAARIYGNGYRDLLYPSYVAKNALWANIFDFTDQFGFGGKLIYYFQYGNPQSMAVMADVAQKNKNSYSLLVPRQVGDTQGGEGVDVINPPTGLMDVIHLIEKFEHFMRLSICGETLTAESHHTGLGSNTAKMHQNTFARKVSMFSKSLSATITQQILPVLAKWNGWAHLPPMKFVQSTDMGDADMKVDRALKLSAMDIQADSDELLQTAGFEIPTQQEQEENIQDIDTSTGSNTAPG